MIKVTISHYEEPSLISPPWSNFSLSKTGILTGPCHCLCCCLQWLSVTKQKPLACHAGTQLPPCLWRLHKLQINKLFALISVPAPGLRWGKWPEHVISWFLVSLSRLQAPRWQAASRGPILLAELRGRQRGAMSAHKVTGVGRPSRPFQGVWLLLESSPGGNCDSSLLWRVNLIGVRRGFETSAVGYQHQWSR